MTLDPLPLTRNGKLDPRALPAPEIDTAIQAGYVAPRTAAEQALAESGRRYWGWTRSGSRIISSSSVGTRS